MTRLDQAYAEMDASPEDDILRLLFYERLVESELFILLESDTAETPRLFDTNSGCFVLIFDREERLTAFTEGPANYAAMSGRAVAKMVEHQNIGLALNIGVAPSSFLIPASAVDWLNETLGTKPAEQTAVPERIDSPEALPDRLLTGLDSKLATAEGLASTAYLVAATYQGGRRGHLLAIIDALPGAEESLTRAISEAVIFSGLDAGEIDVAYFAANNPIAAQFANVGLRFDLPKPTVPKPPDVDPAAPPKLR